MTHSNDNAKVVPFPADGRDRDDLANDRDGTADVLGWAVETAIADPAISGVAIVLTSEDGSVSSRYFLPNMILGVAAVNMLRGRVERCVQDGRDPHDR